MPQITLEYSANLDRPRDFRALFTELHRVLTSTGGVRIENCKSRSVRHESFHIGDGSNRHAFVHVTLNLMAGRTPDWKRSVGGAFLDALKRAYESEMKEFDLQITVNVGDIAHETYFKHPEGTLTDVGLKRKVS